MLKKDILTSPPPHCSQRLNIQQLHSSEDVFGSFDPGMSSSVSQTEAKMFLLASEGSAILNKNKLSFQYGPAFQLARGRAKDYVILKKSYMVMV